MFTAAITWLIIICCASICLTPVICAQNTATVPLLVSPALIKQDLTDKKELPKTTADKPQEKKTSSFFDFLNKKAYAASLEKNEEKKKLREKWEELTGVDVFYPYFKAKEIENWVSDKVKIKVFKMRGRLKLSGENNQVRYTFSIKF